MVKKQAVSSVLKVSSTRNHKIFELSEENRSLEPAKHSKLEKSYNKYGCLAYWPIVVTKNTANGKYTILDGQHRFDLCRRYNFTIYYIMIPSGMEIDIAEVNDTQKPWDIEDYSRYWAARGDKETAPHYEKVLDFREEFKIGISWAYALLGGPVLYNSVKGSVNTGNFRLADVETATTIITTYSGLKAVRPKLRQDTLSLLIIIHRIEGFDPHRLVHKAETNKEKFKLFQDTIEMASMFEDLYNTRGQWLDILSPVKKMMMKRGRRGGNGGTESEEDED